MMGNNGSAEVDRFDRRRHGRKETQTNYVKGRLHSTRPTNDYFFVFFGSIPCLGSFGLACIPGGESP